MIDTFEAKKTLIKLNELRKELNEVNAQAKKNTDEIKRLELFSHGYNLIIDRLQFENKKFLECAEFYASDSSGDFARKCLAELYPLTHKCNSIREEKNDGR